MFCLNKDVNYKILQKLDLEDLQTIACLNREFKRFLDNETFWRNLTINKFHRVYKEELAANVEIFKSVDYSELTNITSSIKEDLKNKQPWKYFYLYLEDTLSTGYENHNITDKLLNYINSRAEYFLHNILHKRNEKCLKEMYDEIINPYYFINRVLYYSVYKEVISYEVFDKYIISMICKRKIIFPSFQDKDYAREHDPDYSIVKYICDNWKDDKEKIDQISYIFEDVDISSKFLIEYILGRTGINYSYLLNKITESMKVEDILNIVAENVTDRDELIPDIILDICLERNATLSQIWQHSVSSLLCVEKYLLKKQKQLKSQEYDKIYEILKEYC